MERDRVYTKASLRDTLCKRLCTPGSGKLASNAFERRLSLPVRNLAGELLLLTMLTAADEPPSGEGGWSTALKAASIFATEILPSSVQSRMNLRLRAETYNGRTLCPTGDRLLKLRDESNHVSQDALAGLKTGKTPKAPMTKKEVVDKAVQAQQAHDELVSHVTSCETCSRRENGYWTDLPTL